MIKDKSSGSVTIVSPTIFSQNDDFYFVDDEYLKDGDIIVKPDSSSTYRVGTFMSIFQFSLVISL